MKIIIRNIKKKLKKVKKMLKNAWYYGKYMVYYNYIKRTPVRRCERRIKMILKMEIKKVEKLINEKGYIPVTNGSKITLLINKDTGKTYSPKKELCVKGAY